MNATSWTYRDTGAAHGVIQGVCARLADRAGVPVWVPRTAFVIFALVHWFFALVLYVVLCRSLRAGKRVRVPATQPAPPAPGDMRDRFSALDKRLADMEAATLQQETNLRRAFRDLERG